MCFLAPVAEKPRKWSQYQAPLSTHQEPSVIDLLGYLLACFPSYWHILRQVAHRTK
jgi:hypothetical protein